MRIVVDASIDPRIVEAFADYNDVYTLFDLGWQELKDHLLVKRLACEVFVTADRGFEYQHNLKALPFGIVIVHAERNKIAFYRPLFLQLREAVATVTPGQVIHVSAVASSTR